MDEMKRTNCREAGRKRLESLERIQSQEDWEREWPAQPHDFPFRFGSCWTHTIELVVDDFEAEAGFWIDVLGFRTNAFARDYAMFTGPDKNFFFSLVPAGERPVTSPDSIRLEFMIEELQATCEELERRGVDFEERLVAPFGEEHAMRTSILRSPCGYSIKLWSMS